MTINLRKEYAEEFVEWLKQAPQRQDVIGDSYQNTEEGMESLATDMDSITAIYDIIKRRVEGMSEAVNVSESLSMLNDECFSLAWICLQVTARIEKLNRTVIKEGHDHE